MLALISRCESPTQFWFTLVNDTSLQVNEDRSSRPAVSQWPGPCFTVKTTELYFDSTQVHRPAHFLSFVQTKIKASSGGELVIVDRYPLPSRETDLVKTTQASSQSVTGELALSINPVAKASMSASQTSGVERSSSRWFVTPRKDSEAGGPVPCLSAVWKYAHNDVLFPERVEGYTFDHELRPSAVFGFQTIKTEVDVELTSLWSSNRNSRESQSRIKDFFPIRWTRTKRNNPIFFNFLYQIAVVVELAKIPVGGSWTMPEMKTDNVKMEDLDSSKSPVPLERTTEIAQQYSESGRIDDIASTDCNVIIKAAVEGRVELTPEERTGVNTDALLHGRLKSLSIGRRSILLQVSQSPDGSSSSSAGRSAFPTPSPSPSPSPEPRLGA